ncbi:DNA-binding transcriptional regulator, ArsR family [Microbacterium sp. RU33B]|nr:DNA-binding transcriptional regulator, ArsR family [Microbacterium sp. RU33B]
MVLRRAPDYSEHMVDIFDVIADGTRRDILQLLLDRSGAGERGTSVSQIVAELGASQPTVSKHLKVLREADLVSVREEGQHRYYSLSPAPLDTVDDWLMPFLVDETDASAAFAAAVPPLPDSAARTADAVGRAAASAKHALESALKKLPGR